MKNFSIRKYAAVVAALCFASPAYADWMSLKFGQDGPDAVERLAAFSHIAPDQTPLAGRSLYGSLDPTSAINLQARFEGRFFVAKVNFVFSAGKLYSVEMAPRNIAVDDVLALLVSEYGDPISIGGLAVGAQDYAWRDESSGTFVLFRMGSSGEPHVIYRPLMTPHSTGF